MGKPDDIVKKFAEIREQIAKRDIGELHRLKLLDDHLSHVMEAGDRRAVDVLHSMLVLRRTMGSIEAGIRCGLLTTALDVQSVIGGVVGMLAVEGQMLAERRAKGIGPGPEESGPEWRAEVERRYASYRES